jgi:predicted Zn-dependent protease with MMP-like domain
VDSAGQFAELSLLQTDGWADAGICAPALRTNIKPIKASRMAMFDIDRLRLVSGSPTVAHPGASRQPLGPHANLAYNLAMTGQFHDWRGSAAPSMSEIEGLASEAYARLPEHFRNLCENLVIRVEDFPTDEVLESMHAESEFDLLGLFQADATPELMPNMIWLYRRPILDYWAEHEDTLGEIVTHVLVHEIGHHFGLSDEDMEAIEASVE